MHYIKSVALIISGLLATGMPASAQLSRSVLPQSAPSLNSTPALAQPVLVVEVSNHQSNYKLGTGDQVDIRVFDYDEYTGSQAILPDGTINLPLIGTISASDRTTTQLAQEITTRLKTVLVNPVVIVNLSRLRPVRVNVAGEVQRPGPIQLQSVSSAASSNNTNSQRTPTVSAALIEAGGVTSRANIRQVLLKRQRSNAVVDTIKIDLWASLQSENAAQDWVLQDGDALFVPKSDVEDGAGARLIARSSYAPKTVRVRVVGEVKNPGQVEVPPTSTLSDAVATAGGPTDKAKLSHATFIRMNENGVVEKTQLDLGNLVDSHQVQDGDVIIVPKSSGSRLADLATQIASPIGLLLRLIGL